jgi:hypothetical protein
MTVHVVKGEFQINVRIFPTLVCLPKLIKF